MPHGDRSDLRPRLFLHKDLLLAIERVPHCACGAHFDSRPSHFLLQEELDSLAVVAPHSVNQARVPPPRPYVEVEMICECRKCKILIVMMTEEQDWAGGSLEYIKGGEDGVERERGSLRYSLHRVLTIASFRSLWIMLVFSGLLSHAQCIAVHPNLSVLLITSAMLPTLSLSCSSSRALSTSPTRA